MRGRWARHRSVARGGPRGRNGVSPEGAHLRRRVLLGAVKEPSFLRPVALCLSAERFVLTQDEQVEDVDDRSGLRLGRRTQPGYASVVLRIGDELQGSVRIAAHRGSGGRERLGRPLRHWFQRDVLEARCAEGGAHVGDTRVGIEYPDGFGKESKEHDALVPAWKRGPNEHFRAGTEHAPQFDGCGPEIRDVVDHGGEPGSVDTIGGERDFSRVTGQGARVRRPPAHRLRRFHGNDVDAVPLCEGRRPHAGARPEIEQPHTGAWSKMAGDRFPPSGKSVGRYLPCGLESLGVRRVVPDAHPAAATRSRSHAGPVILTYGASNFVHESQAASDRRLRAHVNKCSRAAPCWLAIAGLCGTTSSSFAAVSSRKARMSSSTGVTTRPVKRSRNGTGAGSASHGYVARRSQLP